MQKKKYYLSCIGFLCSRVDTIKVTKGYMMVRVCLKVEHIRVKKSYMMARVYSRVEHVMIKKRHVDLSHCLYFFKR